MAKLPAGPAPEGDFIAYMNFLRDLLRPWRQACRAALLRGNRFACPLCGGRFRAMLTKGDPPRANAMCPRCLSLERHRLLWLYFSGQAGETPFDANKPLRVLHMAPEPALEARFRAMRHWDYRTADRAPGRADEAFDLTSIPHGDNRFDLIVCCHVLEHVLDDRQALRELWRVTAPGGKLLLQVPLGEGPTREDPSVADPRERRRLFGQEDHVRLYGLDLVDRLRIAGFIASIQRPWEALALPLREHYRLAPDGEVGEPVFVALKPADGKA